MAPKFLPMPHWRRVVIFTAVLTVVALGACGDDTDGDDVGATDTTAAPCEGDGRTVTVDIGDFVFEPTPVEIAPCDVIVWKNSHNQAHTSTGDGNQKWSTGNIAPGESSTEAVQFPTAGSFTYICALHPFMKGTVTVAA